MTRPKYTDLVKEIILALDGKARIPEIIKYANEKYPDEIEVPKQSISIKVRHVPIDEYLDILYSRKYNEKEIKEEISSKLKEMIN